MWSGSWEDMAPSAAVFVSTQQLHPQLKAVASYNTSDERHTSVNNAFRRRRRKQSRPMVWRTPGVLWPVRAIPPRPRASSGRAFLPRGLVEELAGGSPWKSASAKRIPIVHGPAGEFSSTRRGKIPAHPKSCRLLPPEGMAGLIAEKKACWTKGLDRNPRRIHQPPRQHLVEAADQSLRGFGRDGARRFPDTLQDAGGYFLSMRHSRKPRSRNPGAPIQRRHGGARMASAPTHHYSDGPAWIALPSRPAFKETGDRGISRRNRSTPRPGRSQRLRAHAAGIRHLSEDLGAHGLVLAPRRRLERLTQLDGTWRKRRKRLDFDGPFHSCNIVAEMAREFLNQPALKTKMLERAEKIRLAIEEHGWDGEWYLAGWSDFGNPVGSKSNKEGRVFLNTQTWAVAHRHRKRRAPVQVLESRR